MDSTVVDEIVAVQKAIQDGVDRWARRTEGPERWSWKAEIMSVLSNVGKTYEVRVGPYADPVNEAAWLWDMAWRQFSDDDNNLLRIPLAVESEWNTGLADILFDFRKLIVSRAELRVMIFRASARKVSDRFARLCEEIRQYSGTQKGDRYLLACCHCEESERVEFREHIAD